MNEIIHNENYKDKLFLFFLILLPVSLISGPAIFNSFSAIISILFLFICYDKKLFKKIFETKIIFFLIFYLYLLLSSTLSDNPTSSFHSSLFYIRFLFISLSMYFFLKFFEQYINYFLYILITIFILITIDTIYFLFTEQSIFSNYHTSKVRFRSFLFDYILGSYVVRIVPIIICLFLILFTNKNKYFEIFIFFILTFSFLILFTSGERSAFVHMSLFVILLLLGIKFSKRFYLFFLSSFCITNILLFFFKPNIIERVYYFTLSQIGIYDRNSESFNFTFNNLNIFSQAHENLILVGFHMFKDNIIFGSGPRMFRNLCNDYLYIVKDGCSTHPHNFYIQLLSETGIIGISFLVVSFVYISLCIINKILQKFFNFYKFVISDQYYIILIGIFSYIFPLNTHGNFFNGWISILLYIYIGFFFYFNNLNYFNENNK